MREQDLQQFIRIMAIIFAGPATIKSARNEKGINKIGLTVLGMLTIGYNMYVLQKSQK